MQRAIEVTKKIIKSPTESGFPLLQDINLHKIFESLYELDTSLTHINSIVSFIILAYDNDSPWLNLKQDRYDNKFKIIKSLTDNYDIDLFSRILKNEDERVNDIIGDYLVEQTTWKWRQIMISLDFHSNTLRFVGQSMDKEKKTTTEKDGVKERITEEYDIDLLAKVGKQKGELLKQALEARMDADKLLSEIKKEFVQLDHVVQSDFGFEMTDEKKVDPMSWRGFIKQLNERKKSIASD